MKNFKKLVSIMLALVMAAAMALIPALAAESDSAAPAHTYEIYQIFTGKVTGTGDDQTFSDAKYGVNANVDADLIGTDVPEDVLNAIAALKDLDENARAAALSEYADLENDAMQVLDEGKLEVEGLAPGYYLVKDVDGSQDEEGGNYSLYIVQVVDGTLKITPKVGGPTVEKKIVENEEKVDDNNAAIGDTVTYEIVGTLPENLDKYNTYFYQFNDTLSKGLTYNGDLKVTVDGTDVTDQFTVNASEYDEVTGTKITVSVDDIKGLEGVEVKADSKVVISYTAKLNDNAAVKNPNKVELVYSNNPNDSGKPGEPNPEAPKGITPESTVITYTTELKINKIDGNNNPLAGVKFTLKGDNLNDVVVKSGEQFVEAEDGTYYLLADGTYTTQVPTDGTASYYADVNKTYAKVDVSTVETVTVAGGEYEAEVGADGVLTFYGLKEGTYTLTETVTPDGYNTIKPIEIVISYKDGNFTVTSSTQDANLEDVDGKVDVANNKLFVEIVNKKGSLLPSTGGIGTTIFYVVGSVLVAGAVVLLVVKSKKRAKAN